MYGLRLKKIKKKGKKSTYIEHEELSLLLHILLVKRSCGLTCHLTCGLENERTGIMKKVVIRS